MQLFFDANKYGSVFSKKSAKDATNANLWLATWRDIDYNTRHDLLYKAETNNQAEYGSLLMVLKHLLDNAARVREITNEVTIYGDSQLICYQTRGKYKVKEPDLQPLFLEAVNLIYVLQAGEGIEVLVEWVPRETNNQALGITNRVDPDTTQIGF